jgi:hypothetical protein
VTNPGAQILSPDADEITLIPKDCPFLTLGLLVNLIEVAMFCDTEGVGVATVGVGVATVGDALDDGVTVGDALATDEFVVFAAAVVVALLVSELDA